MPVIFSKKTGSKSLFVVWRISETENELLKEVYLSEKEKEELTSTSHPQKRMEFIAGKLCVQYLVQETGFEYRGLYKDEFGKPHLIDLDMHISISHSFPFAVAILDSDKPVGIDIEKPKDKLVSISSKYLSEQELLETGTNLEKLCVYWSAKEAIYKEYGRKRLIFRENIELTGKISSINGKLLIKDHEKNYEIGIERINEHIVCYTI